MTFPHNPIRAELPDELFEVLAATDPEAERFWQRVRQDVASYHVSHLTDATSPALQGAGKSPPAPTLAAPDGACTAKPIGATNWRDGLSEGELETYDEARDE